jgi:dienelactone hydrolase
LTLKLSSGTIAPRLEEAHAMRLTLSLSAIAALIVSTASAPALETSMSATSSLSADELWSQVGDFCAMPSWHPRVSRCDLSADGRTRTLRYYGINTVAVETLDEHDDAGRSYAFTTVSTPLPLAGYRTRVRVKAGSDATSPSVLELVSSYDAKGISDADARRIVSGSMFRSLCVGGPLRCSSAQQPAPSSEPVWFDSAVASAVPVSMQGYLRRPAGPGPLPAVVLMHGCGGGAEELDWHWGVRIAAWGYVTLTIDRHAPRGLKNACGGFHPAPRGLYPDVRTDAARALDFLVQQPYVDPQRVFVVGFSQGGMLALSAIERSEVERSSANRFRAAAAFYPICSMVRGPVTAPALILIGEKDDWTPADDCRSLVEGKDGFGVSREKGDGPPIRMIVYPGAYHSFDRPDIPSVRYLGHQLAYDRSAADQATEALRDFLRSVAAEPAK